jgi:hypothetical protein
LEVLDVGLEEGEGDQVVASKREGAALERRLEGNYREDLLLDGLDGSFRLPERVRERGEGRGGEEREKGGRETRWSPPKERVRRWRGGLREIIEKIFSFMASMVTLDSLRGLGRRERRGRG